MSGPGSRSDSGACPGPARLRGWRPGRLFSRLPKRPFRSNLFLSSWFALAPPFWFHCDCSCLLVVEAFFITGTIYRFGFETGFLSSAVFFDFSFAFPNDTFLTANFPPQAANAARHRQPKVERTGALGCQSACDCKFLLLVTHLELALGSAYRRFAEVQT